jgi:hypothetical protein
LVFWIIIPSFLFWWAMGTSLNHIYNRFQNYCYKSTMQFLATNMFGSFTILLCSLYYVIWPLRSNTGYINFN